MGDHEGSLDSFQGALGIFRRNLPPDHPIIGIALKGVARAQQHLQRPAEAAVSQQAGQAVVRRSQTRCAGPKCTRKLREDGAPLDVCVKCRRTFYCSKDCQTADWKRKGGHKAECKALIAEGKGGDK